MNESAKAKILKIKNEILPRIRSELDLTVCIFTSTATRYKEIEAQLKALGIELPIISSYALRGNSLLFAIYDDLRTTDFTHQLNRSLLTVATEAGLSNVDELIVCLAGTERSDTDLSHSNSSSFSAGQIPNVIREAFLDEYKEFPEWLESSTRTTGTFVQLMMQDAWIKAWKTSEAYLIEQGAI